MYKFALQLVDHNHRLNQVSFERKNEYRNIYMFLLGGNHIYKNNTKGNLIGSNSHSVGDI